MKNNNCTNTLTMLTVFNNVDAGELTMLDKILRFPDAAVLAASGLNQVGCQAQRLHPTETRDSEDQQVEAVKRSMGQSKDAEICSNAWLGKG